MYPYTDGGLRNVWLANGYKEVKTPYSKGVVIEDIPGLTKAIAKALCTREAKLTGAEFRFVRHATSLSQCNLGKMLGCTEQAAAKWEKRGVGAPKMADILIRCIFIEQEDSDATLKKTIARMNIVDHMIHQRIVVTDRRSGWKAKIETSEPPLAVAA